VQDRTLRLTLLTVGSVSLGEGLPSPCSLTRVTLSHSGEGVPSRFPAPWSILRDAADAAPQDEGGGKGQPVGMRLGPPTPQASPGGARPS
jgi:hypothetical protein